MMERQLVITLIQLTKTLAKKERLTEPEFCCYQQGLMFVENYLRMSNQAMERDDEDVNSITDGDTE